MSKGDLSTELRQRAEETAKAILEAARTDADQISDDADRTIEERRSQVLRSREEEYRTEARTRIAAERHEAMRDVLLAKTRVVDRVLRGAKALLPGATRDRAYLAALAVEVAEAVVFVGAEGATVHCSDTVGPTVREALGATPSVSVTSMNEGSGFMAVGSGGAVRVDGTLEARLERLTPTLAIEIHERLEES